MKNFGNLMKQAQEMQTKMQEMQDRLAEVVEDLIVAACNDAKVKAEATMQEEMAKITGGLNLPPGMKLPF